MAKPDRDNLRQRVSKIASDRLGFKELRLGQETAILNLLSHKDTLVVQPTGSGKSAIYQIAGLLIDGPTVIVSPLIALQKDQIDAITEAELSPAAAIHSRLPAAETRRVKQEFEEGEIEYLFLAPEQLRKEETLAPLVENPPSLFVVDEAHCISEWGHDFRPDYLLLGKVIEALGRPVVLALTATAAPEVREEIISRLGMREPEVLVSGFDRPNIFLRVDTFATEKEKAEALLKRVQFADKPGIIYTATRKHAENLTQELAEEGVEAVFYHGGMAAKERTRIQDEFMASDSQVIAATNAFGMGVDKPDVRFVYHYDIPDSLDSYAQEFGRGGRDGEPAEATLFYREQDLSVPKFLKSSGNLEEGKILEVEKVLENAEGPVPIQEIKEITHLSERKAEKAIQRLEDLGTVERTAGGRATLAPEAADLAEAAKTAAEQEEARKQMDAVRLEKMKTYAELRSCRREYLLRYFGESDVPAHCGNCDNCERETAAGGGEVPAPTFRAQFPVHARVVHSEFGFGVVKEYVGNKISVLFDKAGLKVLSVELLRKQGMLSRPD